MNRTTSTQDQRTVASRYPEQHMSVAASQVAQRCRSNQSSPTCFHSNPNTPAKMSSAIQPNVQSPVPPHHSSLLISRRRGRRSRHRGSPVGRLSLLIPEAGLVPGPAGEVPCVDEDADGSGRLACVHPSTSPQLARSKTHRLLRSTPTHSDPRTPRRPTNPSTIPPLHPTLSHKYTDKKGK